MYISSADELNKFVDRAYSEGVVAVDTEFIREKTYNPELCLIQVATSQEVALIDPLEIEDLSSLARLMEDESITKIFHACEQDLEVLTYALGCGIHTVFDTQIAAAFVGERYHSGLSTLIEHVCGVHLKKDATLTDWKQRPLTSTMMSYAEDDVRYLIPAYKKIYARLVEQDRLGWALPEIEQISDPSRFVHDPRDAYKKLRHSGGLSRRQLAVAQEVCAWRECVAERRNIPKRWLLSDEFLVEICRVMPRTMKQLRRNRGTSQLDDKSCQEILAAVDKAARRPSDKLPELARSSRPHGDTGAVYDLMNAMLRVIAERNQVALQLIATRDSIHDFVHDRDSSPLAHGWRYQIAGQLLEKLLAGEVGLTVKAGRIEIL